MYPHKTFSTDLYDHALNRIYGYDHIYDGVEAGVGDGEGKYGKKGSLGQDCTMFGTMVYMNSIALCDLEINCTRQKNDPGHISDRTLFFDRDNDGNISLGDSYRIDLEPTESRYYFNFYMFNIGGTTAGTNIILNWYDGPIYTLDRGTKYSMGPAVEEISGENVSVRMPINGVSGDPLLLGDVNLSVAEYGHAPRWIFEKPMYDGIEAKLDPSRIPLYSKLHGITVSFHDENRNGMLDGGDYFLLENIQETLKLEFYVKDSAYNRIFGWTYAVSQGMDTGHYPLITMDEPFRSDGNISINVTGVDAYFPEIDRLYYILDVPEKDLQFDTDRRVNEIFSDDGTVRFAINDTDENSFFTKGDRVEIDGLEPGIDYIFKILSWHGYPVYELEAVA